MRKLLLVARREYVQRVVKRSFLLAAIGIPLLMIVVMGVTILFVAQGASDAPVGYVDEAALLNPALAPAEDSIAFRRFETDAEAQEALTASEIQAYFYLPAGYPEKTERIEFYYESESPGGEIIGDIDSFIRASLLQGYPSPTHQSLREGLSFSIRDVDGSRELDRGSWINFVIPFVAAFFFFFTVVGSSGYLLQTVAEEKENRTIEIMVSSMSPEQLIGGKALGLLAVSLTQIGIWVVTAVVALLGAARFYPVLQTATVPWVYLGVVTLFFLPAFALVAGLMTAIGGMVTQVQQGQQIAGILNLVFIIPFFFVSVLMINPNSPLVMFLTLFPTTSFLTVALRWGMSSIPLWQMVLSWLLLTGTAVFMVWAAARIFRAGMLRYGQRLSLRHIITAVRTPQSGL
jgi:ABC-2 type transport system permease protein